MSIRRWAVNALALPLDYFVAGFAWQLPGMTISSRCGIAQLSGEPGIRASLLRVLGRFLNWLDEGHTFHAIDGDLARIERTRERLERWGGDQAGA